MDNCNRSYEWGEKVEARRGYSWQEGVVTYVPLGINFPYSVAFKDGTTLGLYSEDIREKLRREAQ